MCSSDLPGPACVIRVTRAARSVGSVLVRRPRRRQGRADRQPRPAPGRGDDRERPAHGLHPLRHAAQARRAGRPRVRPAAPVITQFACPDPQSAGWTTYCSSELNDLIVRADAARDTTKYDELLSQANEILKKDMVIIPLKDKGKHIITSKIEHHAILHSAQKIGRAHV